MMRHAANKPASPALGIFSPLRYTVFRRIWTASLLSNLGLLVLGVGAAWAMTKISSSTGMVALVQTSLMLPVALVSTPAGAIADMFDRRIVGLVALSIALAGSILLSTLAWLGVMTPALLLVSCFIIGSGMALFGPAWQASVSEQVPAEALPAAVALNGISYNIARSFGPAIGGVIVASAGAVAAFISNSRLYLPLLIVLFFWRLLKEPSRLPPDLLARAVISFATSSTRRPFELSLRPWLPGLPAVQSRRSCHGATSCMAARKHMASKCWGRLASVQR